MKRTFLIAVCILMLSSLLLLVNLGTTKAYLSAYSYDEWGGFTITFDGKWTNDDEWAAAPWRDLSGMAQFRGVVDMTVITYQTNLIEFFSDTTNDTGDYWQICMHNSADGPSAPDESSYRIELVGHTTLQVYQGNGVGWTLLSSVPTGLEIVDAMSTSPLSGTPHWTCEIRIDKTSSPINAVPPIGIRVAAYDASNPDAGVQAWPPEEVSSRDNPSLWGYITGYAGDIPEGLSFGAVLLLSSAAAAGAFGLKKKSKWKQNHLNSLCNKITTPPFFSRTQDILIYLMSVSAILLRQKVRTAKLERSAVKLIS